MNIRPAEIKDLSGVNSLLHQVLEVHAKGRPDIFKSGQKKYTDSELLSIFKNPSTPVFVAVGEQERVVGYAFCALKATQNDNILKDRRELYIDDLCVDENLRGKHIGRSLFEYVKAFAEEGGFDAITLNVWSLNDSALKFYEKCGFSPLKTVMERKIK